MMKLETVSIFVICLNYRSVLTRSENVLLFLEYAIFYHGNTISGIKYKHNIYWLNQHHPASHNLLFSN
jgi:hypothetical protein